METFKDLREDFQGEGEVRAENLEAMEGKLFGPLVEEGLLNKFYDKLKKTPGEPTSKIHIGYHYDYPVSFQYVNRIEQDIYWERGNVAYNASFLYVPSHMKTKSGEDVCFECKYRGECVWTGTEAQFDEFRDLIRQELLS